MSEKIILELNESNKVEIHLHGATITSWISRNKEILFVSKKSAFDNIKAIRGGIPVVFPNFGPWEKGPQHGFARIKKWTVKEPVSKTNDSAIVKLSLKDDEETKKLWNFNFELIYELVLKENSLKTNLTVINTGNEEFDFTSLLHTYFLIDDIGNIKIKNLNGLEYVDKVKNATKHKETRDDITISEETDRIYASTGKFHVLDTGKSLIKIEKENFPDTVVWNPWIERSKAIADFGDEEYKNMVCIEAGYVSQRYILKPNNQVTMGQTISVHL